MGLQKKIDKYDIIGNEVYFNFEDLKYNNEIESLIIKNYCIDNKLIGIFNSMVLLKKIDFINCYFKNNNLLEKIESLTIDSCEELNKYLFSKQIQKIVINDCKIVDINLFENLNLKELQLEEEIILNMEKIHKYKKLEKLHLKDINIGGNLNLNEFENLKEVNFSGSNIEKKEEIIQYLKGRNIKVIFMKKNIKVD